MGMQQTVTFSGAPPSWAEVRDLLARHGLAVEMRMIDAGLAFPDEDPPEPWKELRVATAAGMVSLRRGADRVDAVVWGNAEAELRQLWNALTWALAEVGNGIIMTAEGAASAADFRGRAELPQSVRTG